MSTVAAANERRRASVRAGRYRREAREILAALGEPQLRVARDFLEFLRLRDDGDPTIEILANARLAGDVREARRNLQAGRLARFHRWEDVKRDA